MPLVSIFKANIAKCSFEQEVEPDDLQNYFPNETILYEMVFNQTLPWPLVLVTSTPIFFAKALSFGELCWN